jgi:hypothetical protein
VAQGKCRRRFDLGDWNASDGIGGSSIHHHPTEWQNSLVSARRSEAGRPFLGSNRMFKARHEMIALAALLVVAAVALVVFEIAHLGHLHF